MAFQRIQIKLYLPEDQALNPGDTIPVFHRWIREEALDELLIDVADYTHVPDGPGVLLVAHAADYNLDDSEGRRGLLYTRKRDVEDNLKDALVDALRRLLTAAAKLQSEPTLPWAQTLGAAELRIRILDRLRAPNRDESLATHLPDVLEALRTIYGERAVQIRREEDEKRPLTLRVQVEDAPSIKQLLAA